MLNRTYSYTLCFRFLLVITPLLICICIFIITNVQAITFNLALSYKDLIKHHQAKTAIVTFYGLSITT